MNLHSLLKTIGLILMSAPSLWSMDKGHSTSERSIPDTGKSLQEWIQSGTTGYQPAHIPLPNTTEEEPRTFTFDNNEPWQYDSYGRPFKYGPAADQPISDKVVVESSNSYQVIYQNNEKDDEKPQSTVIKAEDNLEKLKKLSRLINESRKNHSYVSESPLPNPEDVCWVDGMEGL